MISVTKKTINEYIRSEMIRINKRRLKRNKGEQACSTYYYEGLDQGRLKGLQELARTFGLNPKLPKKSELGS